MTDRRTIEDVGAGCGSYEIARAVTRLLQSASSDGPVFSADGSLAVIRTDEELAERAREWGCVMEVSAGVDTIRLTKEARADIGDLLDRLALLAAPAPADPEEDGDG